MCLAKFSASSRFLHGEHRCFSRNLWCGQFVQVVTSGSNITLRRSVGSMSMVLRMEGAKMAMPTRTRTFRMNFMVRRAYWVNWTKVRMEVTDLFERHKILKPDRKV